MAVRRILRNTFAISLAYLVEKILLFLFYVYLARIVGDIGVGKFAFASSFAFLFSIIIDAGLGTLLTKDVARDDAKAAKYLGNIITIRIVLSAIALLLTVVVANVACHDEETLYLVYILGISSILGINIGSFTSIFQAFQEMHYSAFLNISQQVIAVGAALYLLWSGYSLIVVTLSFLFGNFITFVVASYIVRNKFVNIAPKIDLKFGKFLLKNSIPFALNTIAIAIFIRIDIVMLSLFKGDAVVGWYSVAHSLVYGLLAISFTYGIVIFPVMSQLYDQKQYLKLMFEKSFKFFLIIGVGIGIVGFVLAGNIILQIYGTKFLPSIAILKVMIWVCIFLFFRYIYITMLGAIDKQTICAKILISMALLNVVANLLLIPPFSYMGAVIATLITEIYGVCIGFYFVYRYIPGIVIRNQIPKLLISTPLFIICIVILNNYGLNNIFFAIPIYLCLYIFILFLLRVFDKEELELLRSAFKMKNAETNSD